MICGLPLLLAHIHIPAVWPSHSLGYNNLGPEGGVALGAALKENSSLQTLK